MGFMHPSYHMDIKDADEAAGQVAWTMHSVMERSASLSPPSAEWFGGDGYGL
jgi:hypothetical protein